MRLYDVLFGVVVGIIGVFILSLIIVLLLMGSSLRNHRK